MRFKIKSRWTDRTLFGCELASKYDGVSYGARLGAAVRMALRSGVDLNGADLRGAVLRGAVLRGVDLRGVDLCGAVLCDAVLHGVPVIPNIHQAVYAAASQPGALDMSSWHTCDATHCRAGWVVTLAGEAGAAMEFCLGTPAAAALIYAKSDASLERVPNFYADNANALADMQRLAEAERDR